MNKEFPASYKHLIALAPRTLKELLFNQWGAKQNVQPTAYGHEHKSAEYVLQYKDWILSFEGTDIEAIHFIVQNHMLVKYPNPILESMRPFKREAIENHRSFNDLISFSTIDKGGIN
ncbi:MAG: hypothetical protein LW711_17570 [Saprospiraceae bacterium]|nr:hypothetical protein [Saprospiraceae bacterium]